MLIKMGARSETLADLSPHDLEILGEQAAGVSLSFMDQIFTLLFNTEQQVRLANQPRLAIEMAFFKIHQITPALPIDVLIERMDNLLSDPSLQVSASTIVEEQTPYGTASATPAASDSSTGSADASATNAPGTSQDRPNFEDAAETESQGDVADPWQRVIGQIGKAKPSIAAALSRGQLTSVSPEKFIVAIRDNEYTMNLIKKNLEMVQVICRQYADRDIKIDFADDKKGGTQVETAKQKANELRQQLLNHPLVADAVDIFSGKIEDIKIK
jgi:DNA polymerase-3 subunit gamma/tau